MCILHILRRNHLRRWPFSRERVQTTRGSHRCVVGAHTRPAGGGRCPPTTILHATSVTLKPPSPPAVTLSRKCCRPQNTTTNTCLEKKKCNNIHKPMAYSAHRTSGNVRVEPTSNRSIQHFNRPSSSSRYIPRRRRHEKSVVPRKQTEYFRIHKNSTMHHHIGEYPPLPVVNIAQMLDRARDNGRKLDQCATVPVGRTPAIKCAQKVQAQVNLLMNVLGQIEPNLRPYVLSSVRSSTNLYTPDNIQNVRCDDFEEWAGKCNDALRETRFFLSDVIKSLPRNSSRLSSSTRRRRR